jgi:probable rRNA maturation factor
MIFLNMKIQPDFPEGLMQKAAVTTLELSGTTEADMTIVLTGDEEIRILNRDFLGSDSPTDVLAFPSEETDPEIGHRYLGDVIISLPRAAEQARVRGHGVDGEVQLLVVHGVLHLLGHDHGEEEEKACMWQMQAKILDQLGVRIDTREE